MHGPLHVNVKSSVPYPMKYLTQGDDNQQDSLNQQMGNVPYQLLVGNALQFHLNYWSECTFNLVRIYQETIHFILLQLTIT